MDGEGAYREPTKKRQQRRAAASKEYGQMSPEDFIYALVPDAVQIDDIVLTSDYGKIRFGIRALTGSDFSHAALCTRPGMLFEAVPEGVMRCSVLGTFAPRPEWIRVLRPKIPLPPNKDGLRVADYAEALYGRAYSRRGAAASRFPILGTSRDGSVFCSQLIAQAFFDYGAPLVPGKPTAQIYPGLLLESAEVVDVTEDCIRKLGSTSDADLYNEVVATARQELPGAEMLMNRSAFEAVRKKMGQDLPEHIYSLTDLAIWLSQEFHTEVVKRSDPKILATIESEGMFTWYEAFSAKVQNDAVVLELVAKAAELVADEPINREIQALLDDLSEAIPIGEASLAARKTTAQEYAAIATRTGLQTFARLRDTYQRQYEDAERIHKAQMRIVEALRQRTPKGSA